MPKVQIYPAKNSVVINYEADRKSISQQTKIKDTVLKSVEDYAKRHHGLDHVSGSSKQGKTKWTFKLENNDAILVHYNGTKTIRDQSLRPPTIYSAHNFVITPYSESISLDSIVTKLKRDL